ncbi:MAG: hypothetical protein LBM98_08905 [Oscillospiraceae bacterium]|nr:hypothetical protein [Oscillospiraceae bacterium]
MRDNWGTSAHGAGKPPRRCAPPLPRGEFGTPRTARDAPPQPPVTPRNPP